MTYQSLTTMSDIQSCYSTHQNDPLGLTNCIRAALGLPPVTSGTIPIIDDTTVACLQNILSQYHGPVDSTGHMMLPFQTVLDMVDKVRACLGLPAIPIPTVMSCIMTTCMPMMTPGSPPSDITPCVKNCISSNVPIL